MKKTILKFLPVLITAAFIATGCTQTATTGSTKAAKPAAKAAQPKKAKNVFKGKVVGKSNKAKTISIKVGKGKAAKTMMVKFNDDTQGVKYAFKGEAAIIKYKVVGKDKIATVIKPKLAKLPAGVTEIKTDELVKLVTGNVKMTLVDARPPKRYAQSHLPRSISIPVPKLKKQKSAVLPKDKEQLLVFYCGGPT